MVKSYKPLTQSRRNLAVKRALQSSAGERLDHWRGLVREILSQVPAYTHVPAKEQGITKEPYGDNEVCYFYGELKDPGNRYSKVVTEFHVDTATGYTYVYVLVDWGNQVVDQFAIEDLEDYNLSEVDRIDTAIESAQTPTSDDVKRQLDIEREAAYGSDAMTAGYKQAYKS